MKVQGTYTFEAPLETVWNALFDPEVLARTLPGCEKLEREGNQFKGDINVKMGPVQGKFQGKVDITDIKERESYTMIVDGRGPAGFGKATALMRVHSEGTGTRLDYDSDVQVGGKIASVGQRLIDASSRAIVKQSLEGLNEQIKALAAAPAPRVPPPAVPLTAAPPASAVPSGGVDVPLAAEPAATAAPPVAAPPPAVDPLPEGSPPVARSGDGGWFSERGPTHATAALEAAPGAAAVRAAAPRQPARGPSQASFAFGVAKEVTKELFPLKKILLVVAVLALAWVIFSALRGN